MKIPFNQPYTIGSEIKYIEQAISDAYLSGDGEFTKRCHAQFEAQHSSHKALLTNSCTVALEMSAILARIAPGDEVIMPSYTFASTANAFVLRGGVPVFVDIRPDTLNIDESKIEAAITPKTKAIVPVHYAGVGCEMDTIMAIAARHNLLVIEDAAQAYLATYKGRLLGSIGNLATLSFHSTKNITSGEGGVLLINDSQLINRAEIIWEKGTNRKEFSRGLVNKYTWVDVGSSCPPNEITAAFLWAQLEFAQEITRQRLDVWQLYHTGLEGLEKAGKIRRPIIPAECSHNAHMYYLLLPDLKTRSKIIQHLNHLGISTVFHYVPLHSSPAGLKFSRTSGELPYTDALSERLLRLPLFPKLTQAQTQQVIDAIDKFFS